MAFENPCDKCGKDDCNYWPKCNEYRHWLNYSFKMARVLSRRKQEDTPKTTKWVYQHPDMSRKYLKEGVCGDCPFKADCDDPCSAYVEWYNARMDYFRREAGI